MIKDVMPEVVEKTEFKCPICKCQMFAAADSKESIRGGGFTVWCGQNETVCPAQDVSGHGKNVKEAYDIVKDKFMERKDR